MAKKYLAYSSEIAIATIYTHSKLAQLTAACNPNSNVGSLSNQRVRLSLNYCRRRTVADTITRTDIRDYEYVAPVLADYLTSLM